MAQAGVAMRKHIKDATRIRLHAFVMIASRTAPLCPTISKISGRRLRAKWSVKDACELLHRTGRGSMAVALERTCSCRWIARA